MKKSETFGELLRAKGAVSFLGIAQSTFWRWVADGRITRGIRLSNRVTVWRVSDLEKFIAAATKGN
jgi:predicted DNA-binding transcriptional regulator AlpA